MKKCSRYNLVDIYLIYSEYVVILSIYLACLHEAAAASYHVDSGHGTWSTLTEQATNSPFSRQFPQRSFVFKAVTAPQSLSLYVSHTIDMFARRYKLSLGANVYIHTHIRVYRIPEININK